MPAIHKSARPAATGSVRRWIRRLLGQSLRPPMEALEWRLLLSGSPFASPVTTLTANPVTSMALADVNGDGKLDVVATHNGLNGVSVYLGNGDGTLQNPLETPLSFAPLSTLVADFTGDGRLDLGLSQHATYGYDANWYYVAAGQGDGTFGAPVSTPSLVYTNPSSLDFNGDGIADSWSGNTVSLGLAGGQYVTLGSLSIGTNKNITGDFDGDGRTDVAVLTGLRDTADIYAYSLPAGALVKTGAITMGLKRDSMDTVLLAAGDLNGDGRADLVLSSWRDNEINVVLAQPVPPTLSFAAPALTADAGTPLDQVVVATFTDPQHPLATPADYTATIDWGNSHTSAGTLSINADGSFSVLGSMTFSSSGVYPVTVTITRASGFADTFSRSLTVTDWRSLPDNGEMFGNLNQTPDTSHSPMPSNVVTINGIGYYFTQNSQADLELWSTDGTAAGTQRVRRLHTASSSITSNSWAGFGLTAFGDHLIFLASNSTSSASTEIWVSDGTEAGTFVVSSGDYFSPVYKPGVPINLIAIRGSMAYFVAQSNHVSKLYRTDGTRAGTQVISTFSESLNSIYARRFVASSNDSGPLYLYEGPVPNSSGQFVIRIWTSDGTADGTRVFTDLLEDSSAPVALSSTLDNALYLVTRSTVAGTQLWKVAADGTAQALATLSNVSSVYILYMRALNGRVWVQLAGNPSGTNLWISDGTVEGTQAVSTATATLDLYRAVLWGSSVLAPAYNAPAVALSTFPYQLWISDGTAEGTQRLAMWSTGLQPGISSNVVVVNSESGPRAYFIATDSTRGTALWSSDGTASGTVLAFGAPLGISTSSLALSPAPGGLYLTAYVPQYGYQLFTSDGTLAGTQQIGGVPIFDTGSDPAAFTRVGNQTFFTADDGEHGRELWVTDGTAAGTHLVKDLQTGSGSPNLYSFTAYQGALYFFASSSSGNGLWRTDGTEAGTVLLATAVGYSLSPYNGLLTFAATIYDGAGNAKIQFWQSDGTIAGTHAVDALPSPRASGGTLTIKSSWIVGDRMYFNASDKFGLAPYISDGTAAGTLLFTTPSGALLFIDRVINTIGNGMLFLGKHATYESGTELWFTDGTLAGTRLLVPYTGMLYVGSTQGTLGDRMLFTERYNSDFHSDLWVTDGTVAGTKLLLARVTPRGMINLDGALYFLGRPGADYNRYQLWKTDGTPEGTVMLADAGTYGSESLLMANHRLFWGGADGLYVSDGTAAGTHRLVVGDTAAPTVSNLTVVNDVVFFFVGTSLWRSDGTQDGTWRVSNDLPNSISGVTIAMAAVGADESLLFTGYDGSRGTELWRITRPVAPTLLAATPLSASEVSLTWADNAGNETGYLVERQIDGGAFVVVGRTVANVTTWVDRGLSSAAVYGYRVRAFNAIGSSQASEVLTVATNDQLPAVPTQLVAIAVSGSAVDLRWTLSGTDITGIVVERQLAGETEFSELATLSGAAVTYRDETLATLRTHRYRVRAINSFGTGWSSLTASATLVDQPLAGTGLAITPTACVTFSGPVASFADAYGSDDLSPYTAAIEWGDGTTSAGVITRNHNGVYHILGSHTYTDATPTATHITLSKGDAAMVIDGSVTVRSAPVTVTWGGPVLATEATAFSGVLARFTTPDSNATAADFTATISWAGEGTGTGTVFADPAGGFAVVGEHTFGHAGQKSITVQIRRSGQLLATVVTPTRLNDAPISFVDVHPTATKNASFTGVLAHFDDTNSLALESDYTVRFAWGGYLSNPALSGSVVANADGGFDIIGTCKYTLNGSYSLAITLTNYDGTARVFNTAVTVVGVPLTLTPAAPITAARNVSTNWNLGTLVDSSGVTYGSTYTITVAWGDGTSSTSTRTPTVSSSQFTLTGTHAYTAEGNYVITVTVQEVGGQSASATLNAAVPDQPIDTGMTDFGANGYKRVLMPDGNWWIALPGKIIKLTAEGVSTEYVLSTGSNPTDLAMGPDGNIWYCAGSKVGVLTAAGTVKEYALPTKTATAFWIISGPDGNLWVSEGNKIARVSTAGVIKEFASPSTIRTIRFGMFGSDGNLWCVESDSYAQNSALLKITPLGVITEYFVPFKYAVTSMTMTSDGAFWFAENYSALGYNTIARMTPVVTDYREYPSVPAVSVFKGPDGAAWGLTKYGPTLSLLRVAADGTTTSLPLNPDDGFVTGVSAGSDGAFYLTQGSMVLGTTLKRITLAGETTVLARVSSYNITAPKLDRNGNVWLAGNDQPGSALAGHLIRFNLAPAVGVTSGSPATGTTFTARLASFRDTDPTGTAGDFSASIDWGDGTTSIGQIVADANVPGQYWVVGTHAYRNLGHYATTVTVNGTMGVLATSHPPIDITQQGVSTLTLSASAATPVFGEPVSFTAKVQGPSPDAVTPTGSVVFKEGTVTLATVPLDANGQAVFTTSSLSAATHTITATYSGDVSYKASSAVSTSVTVSKAATTATLTSSLNPAAPGQGVNYIVTVRSSTGAVPTGSVVFKDGGTVLSTRSLSATTGSVTLSLNTLPAGLHTITAVYQGTTNFLASTSNAVSETIAYTTTTTLTMSGTPAAYGSLVTLTATLASAGGPPTGTVDFKDAGVLLGTVAVDATGVARWSSSTLAVASHSFTATYTPKGFFQASTSKSLSQSITKAGSVTTLTSSTSAPTLGSPLTLTATVSPATSGMPGGTVTFKDGSTVLGTATLDAAGKATYAVTLGMGSHSFTAVYAGNSSFNASTSAALVQSVRNASSTTLASSVASPVYGQPLTLTATVSSPAGMPTGTVTFFDGTTALGAATVNSAGSASLTVSTLTPATHNLTASYSGSTTYVASTSAVLAQVVKKSAVSVRHTSSIASAVAGDPVTFTATVIPTAPGGGVPTGTVQFRIGTTVLDTIALDAAGTATFTTTDLPLGNISVTAYYGGDGNFFTNSANVAQKIVANASATTLSSSVNPAAAQQSVQFTATVTSAGGKPTGSVSFKLGAVTLATVSLNTTSGIARYTTSTLAKGDQVLTAVYNGDLNFASSNASLTQTINALPTSLAITASAASAAFGADVTLTATISTSGVGPSGSVVFYEGETVLGTANLVSGNATLNLGHLPVGTHSLQAVYGGDAAFDGSTASSIDVEIVPAATATALATSANPSIGTGPVAFTATVTNTASGVTPAGTVRFYDGTTLLGTAGVASDGTASLAVALAVGYHNITAEFASSTGAFVGSTSAALVQAVQSSPDLPIPWIDGDIGSTGALGSGSYKADVNGGTYSVSGAGGNIAGSADAFNFLYQSFSGDFTFIARLATLQNTNAYAKAGLMLRQGTAANAAFAAIFIQQTGGAAFQSRNTAGATATQVAKTGYSAGAYMKLVRSGSTVSGYVSSNGSTWVLVSSITLSLSDPVQIGLAVTSHVTGTLNTSTFDHLTLTAGT